MDSTIIKIKKKFVLIMTSISFGIVIIIILALNLLINLRYQNEVKTISDTISQNALDNISYDIDNVDSINIVHQDFKSNFGESLPTILYGVDSFYIITNNNNDLLEINYGNLWAYPTDDEITEYLNFILNESQLTGTIILNNGIIYTYTVYPNGNLNVITFIYNDLNNSAIKELLPLSILVGLILIFILCIIITILSKNILQPLRTALERQKQFISNASHELKTPVTVISATSDVLSDQMGDNKWIICIKEQSVKMERLVRELLALARMSEIVAEKDYFKTFDLSQIVNSSLLSFECRAYEENRILVSQIEDGLTMFGDKNRIAELVNILVDNALKYSPKGSQITVTLSQSKNRTILDCKNYFDNLDSIDVNRLFDRFYRGDSVQTEKKNGFGLGLSIARSIVEYHEGTIKATKDNDTIKFIVTFK